MELQRKIKIIFSKTDDMRFISHLDLLRLFQRASRRARLPVSLTQGFNPHLKISITRALKLGVASQGEEAIFYIDEPVKPGSFMESINSKLPSGVKVVSAEEIA